MLTYWWCITSCTISYACVQDYEGKIKRDLGILNDSNPGMFFTYFCPKYKGTKQIQQVYCDFNQCTPNMTKETVEMLVIPMMVQVEQNILESNNQCLKGKEYKGIHINASVHLISSVNRETSQTEKTTATHTGLGY